MLSKDYSTNDYYFNDSNKEVVFRRYDMPTPWMNYLSNGTFHTMMSQAGGALTFYRSPQIWRINRYRFFHLPTDRSGVYVYVRDAENGFYHSLTAEPCDKKPESFESAHGMGYTRFDTQLQNIKSNLTYFVSPFDNALVLKISLTNTDCVTRKLQVFGYVEFALMEFMRELQWQCYNKHQVNVLYQKEIEAVIYDYAVEDQPKRKETPLVFFVSGLPISGYDGDRNAFVGSYRSESNPLGVELGQCFGSTLRGGDPCGALMNEISLAAGESKDFNYFLGTGSNIDEITLTIQRLRSENYAERAFDQLKIDFDKRLSTFTCCIPDDRAERMINIWNPYQVWYNYVFSRNISFYATGTFRGTGYRDTAQDVIAMATIDIDMAKSKLCELLSQQYNDGHVNHYYFPIEGYPPVTSVHSDDHLWSIAAVYSVLAEEGSTAFLQECVSYYDGGQDTVYNHLKKAIEFTVNHLGERGFPLMLRSDWNDALYRVCRKGKGESIWTSMQLGWCLLQFAEMAEVMKDPDSAYYRDLYNSQKKLVNDEAWDGSWYRRAITDEGRFLGSDAEPQAKIWLNSQTWAVLSGYADKTRGSEAMNSVKKYLDTDLGIKKLHPSMEDYPSKEDSLTNYNKGTSENGGIFCHANTWAVIAECLLNRSEYAWKYYSQLIPQNVSEKIGLDRYKAEPYIYSSNLFGPESDKFGYANVSWLTGTAAWMYIAATQYILGIRPTLNGLKISPCVPEIWSEFSCNRVFRGCSVNVRFTRGNNKGVYVNGEKIKGDTIDVKGQNTISVEVIL